MSAAGPITEADLHAAADGRLDPAREALLEAHLSAHPADAERLAFYRQLNRDLHQAFDPLLSEPGSAVWFPPRRGRWWRHPAARIAAAFASLLVGGAAGWMLRDLQSVPPESLSLAQQAAVAHAVYVPEVRHPVEVPGTEEDHLVRWLSNRLGGRVVAPRLTDLGYDLVGGRLLPAQDGAAAQFMYENAGGTRVTLYVKAAAPRSDTAFRYLEEKGLSVWYWRDANFGYALAAELPRDALLKICNAIYAQLGPGGETAHW